MTSHDPAHPSRVPCREGVSELTKTPLNWVNNPTARCRYRSRSHGVSYHGQRAPSFFIQTSVAFFLPFSLCHFLSLSTPLSLSHSPPSFSLLLFLSPLSPCLIKLFLLSVSLSLCVSVSFSLPPPLSPSLSLRFLFSLSHQTLFSLSSSRLRPNSCSLFSCLHSTTLLPMSLALHTNKQTNNKNKHTRIPRTSWVTLLYNYFHYSSSQLSWNIDMAPPPLDSRYTVVARSFTRNSAPSIVN